MIKRALPLALPFLFVMCDFGPAPLKLGEPPKTNAKAELTVPLNVTRSFSPTGYFYNVWAPADTTFTQVDPEKWNNFLAYQSIFQHPSCADRVSPAELASKDSSLAAIVPYSSFYREFDCTQFTYAPIAEDDLYGGVFWLRGNNFGDRPGVKVHGGAKKVVFWARSLGRDQTAKFGVGVTNSSVLKPWYYFAPNVDEWGAPTRIMTARMVKEKTPDGLRDTVVAKDSLPEGSNVTETFNLTTSWKKYEIPLGVLYAFNFRKDTVKTGPDSGLVRDVGYDSLPDHNLIGAFYWAIDAAFISDSSRVAFITLPNGTRRQVRYGSGTILIDGIRYE